MASTWGDSWGISWSFSWDITDPEPVVVVGGRLKGELFRPKHNSDTYNNRYPPSHHKELAKSAKILATAGGHARAASLSPQQRTQIAMKAANARWK